MGKLKKIFTSSRVIVLIIALLISVYAIHPSFDAEGVAIRSVMTNSSASNAGVEIPKANAMPMTRERVTAFEVDYKKQPVTDLESYYEVVNSLTYNKTIKIITNKKTYTLRTLPEYETVVTGELVEIEVPVTKTTVKEINGTNVTETVYVTEKVTEYINGTEVVSVVNKTKTEFANKTYQTIVGMRDIGLIVYDAPSNNIKKGLDLQGGTRVLLEPETKLSEDEMDILKGNMEKRLNIYGLSDIIIRSVRDKPAFLGGSPKYILVEIPGANEQEVKDLLSKQGKFEAKIGDDTVFRGGQDITYVCRSADCSGIDPMQGCQRGEGNQIFCRFRFEISLSPEAAKRQAELTKDLAIIGDGREQYLEKKLELYLDNSKVDELSIGSDLRGRDVTDIQISGGGSGATQQEAMANTLANMKKLQTVLITGSLPVKMEIVRTDNISPVLGNKFIKNAVNMGAVALLAVALVVFVRYRKLKLVLPMSLLLASEVVLLLGLAAFIGWNMDIASIAGLIIVVGTGVDQLIVITDESLKGTVDRYVNWKQKIANAFFIIMAAYLTTCVAMVPLLFAGAGLLKGFAFTTLAGETLGVFIARPAYATIVEILLKE